MKHSGTNFSANCVDQDQTAPLEQSDQSLHFLPILPVYVYFYSKIILLTF